MKFSVDSDYNSLSNEAKTEAWKNPENPSVGTKLTCVFGPEKKLPESIPEEPVSLFQFNWKVPILCEDLELGSRRSKTCLTLTP